MALAFKKLKLDDKKRVSLGKLGLEENITGFNAYQEDGRIILEPTVDIPARELWLYRNPEALEKVERGLKQAAEGKTKPLDPSLLADDDGE